ncbi:MAG: polysaccharide deacetylase family protein [Acidobacteria bacterium]|nr:polysaccharide deacetylase family protein [Acidobacteriota bacterium]MDA1233966.1 polysaccharide deacetylase family protein [Acidobacteriota bacterium]
MPRAILTYHSIDDSGSIVSTTTETLRLHLASLVAQGVEVVAPGEVAEARSPSAVALTFDDGFANFYTDAFPALSLNGLTATVLIVAGRCGQSGDWARQPPALKTRELLTWSKIQELQAAGIEFGAHSMTHPSLPDLPIDKAASEILDSKRAIEDRTGAAVECFAYPYGEYTQPIADVVAENFRIGLSTEMGFVTRGSSFEALERIDAYYLRSAFWIDRLFAPLGGRYIACRAAARGLKKRFEKITARASAQ